ncbi:MAG: MmcQ/YjbR family DNA-binding protein [Motilibacteraceae bacterium]
MADWADVRRLATALPEVTEDGSAGHDHLPAWKVRDKAFAWERPLRRGDLEALGDDAPDGPVLGLRTADLGAKEAALTELPGSCFTTPHFDGYPAVLVRLDEIDVDDLEELLTEAWLARAPKRLARELLAAQDRRVTDR